MDELHLVFFFNGECVSLRRSFRRRTAVELGLLAPDLALQLSFAARESRLRVIAREAIRTAGATSSREILLRGEADDDTARA